MILYHGSYVEVRNPKIIIGDATHDFGFAFYLTEHREQAERWAKIKVRRNGLGKPIVSVFDFDEDILELDFKEFPETNEEWLDVVSKCRTIKEYNHGFDIVKGKIADDKVGETITFYLEGVITKEQTIERLKYSDVNSQIAFCTEESLKHLKFKNSYEVK